MAQESIGTGTRCTVGRAPSSSMAGMSFHTNFTQGGVAKFSKDLAGGMAPP